MCCARPPAYRASAAAWLPLSLTLCFAATRAANAQAPRTQLEVRLAGPPTATTARVLSVFADSGVRVTKSENGLVEGELPEHYGLTDRAGMQTLVQAVIVPAGADSSRVVLSARLYEPKDGILPETTTPVTEKRNKAYGKLYVRAWQQLLGLQAALGGARHPEPGH